MRFLFFFFIKIHHTLLPSKCELEMQFTFDYAKINLMFYSKFSEPNFNRKQHYSLNDFKWRANSFVSYLQLHGVDYCEHIQHKPSKALVCELKLIKIIKACRISLGYDV